MITKTTCERMNTNHNHNIEAEEENTTGDKIKFDVLPGRGKGVENHAGNIIYRGLVSASKDLYAKCHERDKKKISLGIVDAVRKIGGRFLTYDEDRKIYTDLDDEKARVKASQALRDALNSRRNSQKENGVYEEEEKRCTNEVPQEWYSNYLYQELMRNHSNSSTRTTDAEQISQREGDRDENVLDSLEPLNYKHDHGLPNRNLTKKSISTRSEFSQLSKDVMSSMSGMSLSTLSLDADMLDVEKFSVPENKNVSVITPGSKRSTSRKMEFPIRESVVDDYEQGMLTVIGKKSASVPEEKLSTLTFNEEGVGQKDNDSFFRLADKVAKNNAGVPLSGHSLMSS